MRRAWPLLFVMFVACGDDEAQPTIDAAGGDATVPDAGVDGGEGAICGGLAGLQCDPGFVCDWADNSCGADDGTGTCRPTPDACTPVEEPACGCDGVVYANPCEAELAGHDVSDAGGCEPPTATDFACGHLFCDSRTEYCERTTSDVVGQPDTWGCRALPGGCGATPDCACLADEPCGAMCEASGVGLRLTCPGG